LLAEVKPGRTAHDQADEQRRDDREREDERATAGRHRRAPIVEQRTGIRMVERRVEL
jgi:hypothetical protein